MSVVIFFFFFYRQLSVINNIVIPCFTSCLKKIEKKDYRMIFFFFFFFLVFPLHWIVVGSSPFFVQNHSRSNTPDQSPSPTAAVAKAGGANIGCDIRHRLSLKKGVRIIIHECIHRYKLPARVVKSASCFICDRQ